MRANPSAKRDGYGGHRGIVGKGCREGGQPAQHPDSGGVYSGGVDAMVQHGGGVGGVIDAAILR